MKEIKLTKYEKENYLLKDKRDLIILLKIKNLEKRRLNKADKEIINLIRTQLKKDWRSPLVSYLNKLAVKYKK